MNRKNHILVLVFMLLMLFPLQAKARELTFSTLENMFNIDISQKIIEIAYQRIGIQVSIIKYPGLRALLHSNNGDTDGELHRVANINKKYPNLIIVPVQINVLDGMVYTKDTDFPVKGWDSLKPYRIGIRRGVLFSVKGTSGMNTFMSDAYQDLFKVLNKQRIDIIIAGRVTGLKTIQDLNLNGIRAMEPPIESYPIYHYLHKKNRHIIPEITKVLQEMEKEGLIQKIRQEFLIHHFGSAVGRKSKL